MKDEKLTRVRMADIYKKFTLGQQTEDAVSELRELWRTTLPSLPVPADEQFQRWLGQSYGDPEPLIYGMAQAVKRISWRPFNDATHHLAFISSCAIAYLNAAEKGRAA
jgi:hypothetical protein